MTKNNEPSTVTLVWKCDNREAALKLMLEVKSITRGIDDVFLESASLDEDWFNWLQSVLPEKNVNLEKSEQ